MYFIHKYKIDFFEKYDLATKNNQNTDFKQLLFLTRKHDHSKKGLRSRSNYVIYFSYPKLLCTFYTDPVENFLNIRILADPAKLSITATLL